MKFAIKEIGGIFFQAKFENDVLFSLKKVRDENISDFGEATEFSEKVFSQLSEYFRGKRKSFDIKYKFVGTPFQIKVWQALAHIEYGKTATYKDIAAAVGNSKASRAVGGANNKNPISIIVPCHRVIGASGKLVGYAGGLDMKDRLLKLEKENV